MKPLTHKPLTEYIKETYNAEGFNLRPVRLFGPSGDRFELCAYPDDSVVMAHFDKDYVLQELVSCNTYRHIVIRMYGDDRVRAMFPDRAAGYCYGRSYDQQNLSGNIYIAWTTYYSNEMEVSSHIPNMSHIELDWIDGARRLVREGFDIEYTNSGTPYGLIINESFESYEDFEKLEKPQIEFYWDTDKKIGLYRVEYIADDGTQWDANSTGIIIPYFYHGEHPADIYNLNESEYQLILDYVKF